MSYEVEIKVKGYRCLRCGHVWIPDNKKAKPKVCPKCKSPYWDTPRKLGIKNPSIKEPKVRG